MYNDNKFKPTDLELRLIAERQAAEDDARRAIEAERAKMVEQNRERMRAEEAARAAERAEKGDPVGRAARAIRAAIADDAWPAVVTAIRTTDAVKLRLAMLSLRADEEAAARHAEIVAGLQARVAMETREKAERQAALEARAAELAA